eukprot:1140593-Pelagomonas_calceolata.AAC.2
MMSQTSPKYFLHRSACCRCAASTCCPDLVSPQYLISILSARAAGLHPIDGAALRGKGKK